MYILHWLANNIKMHFYVTKKQFDLYIKTWQYYQIWAMAEDL